MVGTKRYIRHFPKVLESRLVYIRWALTAPFRSRAGGKALARHVDDTQPAAWAEELRGQRVLIVGSGPSLDRVDKAFFDRFDTVIYINFAIRRKHGRGREYFFTTDIGPIVEFLDAYGADTFETLGPDHCILAPIYLDQWHMVTKAGRALFTWLRFDSAGWFAQKIRIGSIRLPLLFRYRPHQPDWDTFRLPPPGRALPVLIHTSALTAILFAAINGSREIGLIGCDFSAGRADSAQSTQAAATQQTFAGAAGEFATMKVALARDGIELINHSWLV